MFNGVVVLSTVPAGRLSAISSFDIGLPASNMRRISLAEKTRLKIVSSSMQPWKLRAEIKSFSFQYPILAAPIRIGMCLWMFISSVGMPSM
jgi:hypothetical protein